MQKKYALEYVSTCKNITYDFQHHFKYWICDEEFSEFTIWQKTRTLPYRVRPVPTKGMKATSKSKGTQDNRKTLPLTEQLQTETKFILPSCSHSLCP